MAESIQQKKQVAEDISSVIGETSPKQPDITLDQLTNEEQKGDETSFQQQDSSTEKSTIEEQKCQPDSTVDEPKNEEQKADETSFDQEPDSTLEKPTDEEQKADEKSSQKPDSTLEQLVEEEEPEADETSCEQLDLTVEKPVDPPTMITDPIDDFSSTTDQLVGEFENEEGSYRGGRAPTRRPGIVSSTPQTNDLSTL